VTPADCGELIAILSDHYQNTKFSENAPHSWHMILAPYNWHTVVAALPEILKANPHFCPSPSAIAAFVDDLVKPKLDPTVAWEVIRSAMAASVGNYGVQPTTARRWAIAALGPERGALVVRAAEAVGWDAMYHGGDERSMPKFIKALADVQKNADRTAITQLLAGGAPVLTIGEHDNDDE
jgi:hypothetical protein